MIRKHCEHWRGASSRHAQAFLRALATLLLLPASGSPQGAEPTAVAAAAKPIAVLELRVLNGQALIPAQVNDSGPLSFLLDTGYGINTIHPDLVDSLNLRRAGKVTIVGISGEEDAPMFAGARFRFGEAIYEPRRVASVPSEGQRRRRRRDGIVGAGFFRRFVVEMDVARKSIRLFEPGEFVYAGTGQVLPLTFRKDTPIIEAAIHRPAGEASAAARGQFEIDTGCDDGVCLGHEFVKKHQLEFIAEKEDSTSKQGVGGDARVRPGTIERLQLGSATAEKVSASLFQDGSPADEGLAGHIGLGALSQFKVIFDYRNRKMILER